MHFPRNVPLLTYVRRILVGRLALVAAVIALTLASLAYLAEERMMAEAVMAEAQDDLAVLAGRTREIISHDGLIPSDAFRKAVGEKIAAGDRKSRRGKAVYARYSRPGISGREEYLDRSFVLHDAVQAHVQTVGRPEPGNGVWSETVYIADILCVHAVLPIDESGRSETGYAEIVFVPAPAVLAAMERKALYTVGAVAFVALATAALLYPVILRLTNRLVAFSRNLQAANFETLALLGCAVAKRDSDTDEHNYRVTLYALRMAEAIGLDAAGMRALAKGAFLHDVGKIAIRDSILLKPGKLTHEEFETMKTHVRHGLDVVDRSTWLRDAKDVVGCHHEKFDGKGYPGGISGKDIPLAARIFTVADVFDALTSRRPYKNALSCAQALDILRRGRGKHFDPEIVDTFIDMAAPLHERYAHRSGRDLSAELIDVAWKFFHAGADTLVS
ncbi:MAG: HD-GYP domain-containing protein [Deltaproteobacteria bacterium HGW-Deltaproteobacteria-18]|jgi:HD-GYP domain-containing protein (c-di-GMP phosphodiesterase class II)|nr:MAG: HD-GYP domain-containing protein [Deltaproteobacteria bacterium HGW-Deltaproteobacteria-18]